MGTGIAAYEHLDAANADRTPVATRRERPEAHDSGPPVALGLHRPDHLSPGSVHSLQRSVGNQAVTRLLAGRTPVQRGCDCGGSCGGCGPAASTGGQAGESEQMGDGDQAPGTTAGAA